MVCVVGTWYHVSSFPQSSPWLVITVHDGTWNDSTVRDALSELILTQTSRGTHHKDNKDACQVIHSSIVRYTVLCGRGCTIFSRTFQTF